LSAFELNKNNEAKKFDNKKFGGSKLTEKRIE
jgi:hypothetical protein